MRSTEVQGRSGKQPDGSARTREAKLCTVWSAEQRDTDGRPQRDPDSVTYTAAIKGAATLDTDPQLSEFAQRVEREAQRRPILGKRNGKLFWETERSGSEMLHVTYDLEPDRRIFPGGGTNYRSFPRQRATSHARRRGPSPSLRLRWPWAMPPAGGRTARIHPLTRTARPILADSSAASASSNARLPSSKPGVGERETGAVDCPFLAPIELNRFRGKNESAVIVRRRPKQWRHRP